MCIKTKRKIVDTNVIEPAVLKGVCNPKLMRIILQDEWNSLAERYLPNIAPEKNKTDNLVYLLWHNMSFSLTPNSSLLAVCPFLTERLVENFKRFFRKLYPLKQMRTFLKLHQKIWLYWITNSHLAKIKIQIKNCLSVQLNLTSAI